MYFEETPSPRLVATATGSMQLVPDDARELVRRCSLVEVRLDALGDGFGPLGIGEVAAMALRIQSILDPLARPGEAPIPLLATAAVAPEAAGRCGTRAESLGLLRAAVQAGFPWIDFDLALAGSLGGDAGAGQAMQARAAELRAVIAGEPRTEVVVSEHWTADGETDGLTPRLEVLGEFLEEALRLGVWPRTVKLIEAPGAGGTAGALAFIARIPEVRALLVEWTRELRAVRPGLLVPELAMFAGGPEGSATRTVCTAAGSDWVYAAARADEAQPVPGQLTVEALCATWPGGRPPGHGTPIFGVLGERIAGSASPVLFTALFEQLGVRGVYGRFDVPDAGAVLEHARSGRLPIVGLSVTAPHKAAAWNFGGGDRAPAAEGASGLRAFNTLVQGAEGAWVGVNTDLLGARAAAEELVGEDWFARSRTVVVLGAGGAARAALRALSDPRATAAWEPWLGAWRTAADELPNLAVCESVSDSSSDPTSPADDGGEPTMSLTVLARDPMRAMALARECGASFGGLDELAGLAPDLIVHATPAGSPAAGDACAWLPGAATLNQLAERAPHCAVLDANYKPDPTPLVAAARAAGLRASTGARWFWAQAAAQLQRFREAAQASADPSAPEAHLPVDLPPVLQAELATKLGGAEVLVLIGARGSGKTTLGREFADRVGLAFRDLDAELAAAGGASSAGELLAARGEAAFRAAESALFVAALEAAPQGPSVWATGGGLLTSSVARVALAAARASGRARCVWLTARPETLAERVAGDPTVRPALFAGGSSGEGPLAEARRVLAERSAAYAEAADLELDTETLEREVLVNAMAAGFGRALDAGTELPAAEGAGA